MEILTQYQQFKSLDLNASSHIVDQGRQEDTLDEGIAASKPAPLNKSLTLVNPCTPQKLEADMGKCGNSLLKMKLMLFSHSVMPDSLQPHELQHTRLPCPPGVCSNSCPLSQ